MVEYYKLALSKYAQFTGRSRRSEFWYFVLGNFVVGLIIGLVGGILGDTISTGLSGLYNLAIFIPSIAVAVRRLHDTGRSGWWYLIAFTIIGIFLLIYWWALDSEPGVNKWGPNPKTGEAADISSHLVD
ncbi:DUF805 domain-containing protein [Neolewinella persica]|uniref:DUF805 domain-containing protein n=1 Tax=Neolewinella persica TaxID=70998 RepID=UPI000381A3B4|nr:DUF805 domain-containing protein [Neolewinella persica]